MSRIAIKHAIAALSAHVFSGIIYPLELIKTRMQGKLFKLEN
jgi:hypothetical protein